MSFLTVLRGGNVHKIYLSLFFCMVRFKMMRPRMFKSFSPFNCLPQACFGQRVGFMLLMR